MVLWEDHQLRPFKQLPQETRDSLIETALFKNHQRVLTAPHRIPRPCQQSFYSNNRIYRKWHNNSIHFQWN